MRTEAGVGRGHKSGRARSNIGFLAVRRLCNNPALTARNSPSLAQYHIIRTVHPLTAQEPPPTGARA